MILDLCQIILLQKFWNILYFDVYLLMKLLLMEDGLQLWKNKWWSSWWWFACSKKDSRKMWKKTLRDWIKFSKNYKEYTGMLCKLKVATFQAI